MENKAIATADFVTNGTTNYGKKIENLRTHCELSKSNSFTYGNQTCVWMRIGNTDEYLDTRYDSTLRSDGSNFKEWCLEYLNGYFSKGLTTTEA